MKGGARRLLIALAACGVAGALALAAMRHPTGGIPDTAQCTAVDRTPSINPDYSATTIPFNIAPLNFCIREPGTRFAVKISSNQGTPIVISSRTPAIVIPPHSWKTLLRENRGESLRIEVFAGDDQRLWRAHRPIAINVSADPIDTYLVYREVRPQFYAKNVLHLRQRNLEGTDARMILDGDQEKSCFNCHAFPSRRTDQIILQIRQESKAKYMALNDRGKVSLVEMGLEKKASVYSSWHPSGKLIALTANVEYGLLQPLSGVVSEEVLEFCDLSGDIVLYHLDTGTLSTTKELSRPDRIEMQPEWSPDGKTLYFISGPSMPIQNYARVKYDLMRIPYDPEKNAWGSPEILVSSSVTGSSATFPKASPDGRFVLFCLTDRQSQSILRRNTDLYLMDVSTRKYRRIEINSDRSDSYHSWSSNSRWFVFVSKRDDSVFTRLYFSHVDEAGNVTRPFVLPQEDPEFYDSFVMAYNVPEFVSGPLEVNRFTFGREILDLRKLRTARLTTAQRQTRADEAPGDD
jgi:WD40 repeat protein